MVAYYSEFFSLNFFNLFPSHISMFSNRLCSRELMSDLPQDQAQILAKVYMEGKSHSETAAELGLPLGTVKSRVRLAIQKLQVFMDVGSEE